MSDPSRRQAAQQYQVGGHIRFTWPDGTRSTGSSAAIVPPPGRAFSTFRLTNPQAESRAQVTAAMMTGQVADEEEGRQAPGSLASGLHSEIRIKASNEERMRVGSGQLPP